MKIYKVRLNHYDPKVYCADKKLAIDALNLIKKDIRSRSITIDDEKEDSFSYSVGWMESGGTWRIQEFEVADSIDAVKSILEDYLED